MNRRKRWLAVGLVCLLAAVGSLLLVYQKQGGAELFRGEPATEASEPEPSPSAEPTAIRTPEPTQTAAPTEPQEETPAPDAPETVERVNINTATQQELEALPRIGPKLAQRIIEYREQQPFRTVYDIKKIKGIGDKTFQQLENLITVGE